MSDLELEPASFRDPASTVLYLDGRVLRGLTKEGAEDFAALASAPFFEAAMTEGRLVRTTEVPLEELPQSVRGDAWVQALEHERIPFVTYPYEWTFSMLKDAALVHLDLLLAALGVNLTMKDGYAYNLAFVGARPVFIDVGSFERVRPASRGPATGSSARRCCTRCCFRPTRTSASSPGSAARSRASSRRSWPGCSPAPTGCARACSSTSPSTAPWTSGSPARGRRTPRRS
jgi:hypothetical protein